LFENLKHEIGSLQEEGWQCTPKLQAEVTTEIAQTAAVEGIIP